MRSEQPRSRQTPSLRVSAEQTLPEDFFDDERSATLRNFAFYVPFSKDKTELFWAVVRDDSLDASPVVAATPVVRLRRRKATDMLRQPLKRWLGLLFGPLAIKTTLLVDTAFLAYDEVSPFFCRGGDRAAVKRAVSDFLKSQRRVDTVWISEPIGEATWAREQGYDQLLSLPMVHVELDGCATLDEYASQLSKKRRRNFRHEREQFAAAGAVVERHEGPLNPEQAPTDSECEPREKLLAELLECLAASAAHSELTVPYNNVLTDPEAFANQPQTILVARVDGRAVGFMSFLTDGDRLLQCHGGLDYERSHEVLAYHNLIYAGIELALERGCRVMSMGPLNNETKRRAGTHLRPIVSSLWNRWPADRLIARKLFIKNFEVYSGAVPADEQ